MKRTLIQFLKSSAVWLGSFLILLVVTRIASADISNPHPTPPNNSVTAAMLKTGSVTPPKVLTTGAFQMGTVSLGTATVNSGLYILGTDINATDNVTINDSASTSILKVRNNGMVGIGSSTPTFALSVGNNFSVATSGVATTSALNVGATGIKFNDNTTLTTAAVGNWIYVASSTPVHTVNNGTVDFTNLGAYKSIMVVFKNVPCTTSDERHVRVSSDNGSTFYAGATDYDRTGNNTDTQMNVGETNTLGVNGYALIENFNVAGDIKPTVSQAQLFADTVYDINRTEAMNAVRTLCNGMGGVGDTGVITIYGKK